MRFTGILVCFAAWLAIAASAQTTNSTTRTLSLQECLQMALQHNLDVQIDRLTPAIARYTLSGSYGSYDPVLRFGARAEFDKVPSAFDPKNEDADFPYELENDTFSAGILGRLPTGLTYGLSGATDFLSARTDFSLDPSGPINFPPYGLRLTNVTVATAALTLRQPVLKDFWIDAARLNIRVEKKNLKISELALRQQVINVVTKVQLAYYELIFSRERVKVQERALALAQQLLTENRKRVQVGDLPPLDEKQSEAQVESVQADLLAARQALAEQQNLLKNLLTDDYRAWPDAELVPSENLLAVATTFDRSESWQTALAQRPDLLQFRLELEKRDLLVHYRFNQLFPSLDLVGSYGARAVTERFGTAAGDVGDARNPAYAYGVVLSFPLSNQGARNSYKTSKAARQQAELQLKKLEQEILVQIDNAGRLVQTHFQRVNATRQARVFAEAALEAELKKLKNGESTSFVVLQMQKNLTDARSTEIRALADYNKALAQLAFSEGSMLERQQITVDWK